MNSIFSLSRIELWLELRWKDFLFFFTAFAVRYVPYVDDEIFYSLYLRLFFNNRRAIFDCSKKKKSNMEKRIFLAFVVNKSRAKKYYDGNDTKNSA